ncbi:OmpA/MotB [Trichormus variabilis ATCC 29413]|uniref:OmpA/MotB n=4 Tax=Anabaena variabilis TaxID=264691 RepID=Q3MET2_TRIV2|nr:MULTISPECIES: OmpA family protein [Nostocaceae]ABA20504.1 OmpA/MotB [Trichormus variabilis ATCC 29413]MBC1214679.1 OmpA family protein [Trichormus variabilis ARAD]MBC1267003.1 OmpA family protein [Trichormus variabilis FSR]MBC1300851.1 OmpA family protein [Trichormus variabilis N2B]MBC1311721.1 OmpA family protein [Trichormus variabilis PNB]
MDNDAIDPSSQVSPDHDLSLVKEITKVDDELSKLRSLLLGVEPAKLNHFYELLDNPQIRPEDISRLLPEAVILRSQQDKQLITAMISIVEEAIQVSVQQDENILSEAFFPVIIPASRKAIASLLDEMMQSLNQTLEHSFSLESLQWRLEAKRTGKSFAEIVLLRTLVYRVEQIFLIHKNTGLLLRHLVASQVTSQDPDLVVAMLTAIQDFIKDSFSVQKTDQLQSLHFGELRIWITEGPQALLAATIRGNPPQELRLGLQTAIEKIHLKLSREMKDFAGDAEPFQVCQPYLESCLISQYKSASKKSYKYAWTFLGIVAIACGIWSFFAVREQLRWRAYLEELNSQPGIVVTETKQQFGKYFISGLRDPLASDPHTLLQQTKLNPQTIVSHWQSYLSLEPQLMIKRVNKLLQPPPTASLKIDQNGVLYAVGSAPRQWILATRKSWSVIPGLTQFQDQDLVESELKELALYQSQIERAIVFFPEGSQEIIPSELSKLNNLALAVKKLLAVAKYLEKDVYIQIIGHTNTTGTESRNAQLSEGRSQRVLSYLSSQGISTSQLQVLGVSSSQPLQPELTDEGKKFNRRVSFKVIIMRVERSK